MKEIDAAAAPSATASRKWRRIQITSVLVVMGLVGGAAACASEAASPPPEDVVAPDRKDSSSDSSVNLDGTINAQLDGGLDSPDGEDDDAFVPRTCGVMNGLYVICMRQKESYEVFTSVSYGPGFPAGLPAMGLGKTQLGYLPADYPFTCVAKGEQHAKSVNNTAGGKICEVVFDNNVTGTVKGTATYTITIDDGAKLGVYDVGYTANAGATPEVTGFYVKVEP